MSYREQDIQWKELLEDKRFNNAVWEWIKYELAGSAARAARAKDLVDIAREQGKYLAYEFILNRPAFVASQAQVEEARRKGEIDNLKREMSDE